MADQVGMAFIPYYKLLMELLETNEELNKTFTADHCRERHYSFQIRRCHDEGCCPTPEREWAWLPDPILDITGQHYKPFDELLGKETTDKDRPSSLKQTVAAVAQEQQGCKNSILVGQNVRQTVNCCILKMAGLTASGAVIGGFFGGKRGSAVGAAVATFFGCQTLDNYQSILAVLRNLNDEDKQQLVERVQRLVGNITQDALRNYIRNSDQRTKLLTVIRDFAKDVNRDDNPSCDH